MKRFSFFFLLFCLSVVTAFAFVTKSKFDSLDLYVIKNDNSLEQISSGTQSFPGLTTSGSGSDQPAKLTDKTGNARPIVHSTSRTAVYTVNNW